ncbi:MAG: ethanolamine ammonia lyase-activating protein [Chloroflexi bacterium]|nr:ethanolamine ammonia lyase-activating protein [Chloroflexota bacterium]
MVMQGTDMKVAETPKDGLTTFRVPDAYEAWLEKEQVKVQVEFYYPDIREIEVGDWERKGGKGAVCHIDNRHMPNDLHVVEIRPGGKSEPEHHMYEISFYIVWGRGATSVWLDEKNKQTFEWKEGSLFTVPLNAWYQHFNGSGDESVRYIATTNAPVQMRMYRDPEFIFNCDFMFKSRYSEDEEYFSGNGTLYNKRIWETNFIPNAPDMALYGWKERGAGGINAMLQMGKNNMGNHISEFPIGTYKKAHRHGPGAHLVLLSGDSGYSLLWTKEDRSDMVKCDWKVGSLVVVPNDGTYHQHFNSGTKRARYMALRAGDGGFNAPNATQSADVSIKDGGIQVEYTDEDREIHEIFEKELATKGVTCNMKAFIPYCTGEAGVTSENET